MLCTLACVIGAKSNICKRWLHFGMHLLGNMISSTWRKCVVGWPHNCFFFTTISKIQITLNKWPNNTKQLCGLSIFDGQVHNVICGEDWDVEYFVDNLTKMLFGKVVHDMYESNIEAWCAHVGGPSIQLDSIRRMLPNVAMNYLYLIHMKFDVVCMNC
jgi:hypothetical protein